MKIKIIPILIIALILPISTVKADIGNQLDFYLNTNSEEIGWHLSKINLIGAWGSTQGEDIVVAVLDSGINFTHPDLQHAQWINSDEIADNGIDDDNNGYIDDVHGWDFVYDDNNSVTSHPNIYHNYHGSFIAGIIAASHDSNGTVGVAPECKIMDIIIIY